MNETESDQRIFGKNIGWVIFFIFLAIQSIPVIGWLLVLPRDPKNSQIFGLSTARLVLLLLVVGLGALFVVAAVTAGRKKSRIRPVFEERWRDAATFLWLEIIAAGSVVAAWGWLVYLRSGVDGAGNPIYQRLQPLLVWIFALGLQFALWFWIKRFDWKLSRLQPYLSVFRACGYAAVILVITGLAIGISGLGIQPDIFQWGYPGVPLLAWQVCFALTVSFLIITILINFPVTRTYRKRLDWILSISLLLLAVGLWLAQPIPRSYFFPSARAPTFEIFPYSDSGFYDYVSQSVLIGEGFLSGEIVTRPLYILFLSVLHGLVGQNYREIIVVQTLVLAFFPPVLYWLGRSLNSREAGVAAGLLAIFRELNMIAATPLTEVSHSKMLMTDSLTGLGIAVFCLLVIRWLKKADARPLRALIIGGFLGMLQLLRSQAIFLLPVVVILVFLQRKKRWKIAFVESMLLIAGFVLAIAPWTIRNGIRTGDFALDQPSQAAIMAQRYSLTVEEGRNLVLEADSNQVARHVLEFTHAHPDEVARFVSAHFINNELATFTVLPLHTSFDDYKDNFTVSTLFWLDGVKGISGGEWVLLAINLILISIGLGSAAKRWGWVGISPLAFHLAYSLSSAVGRISGWRFIQPVDWIGYFYFCLGFSELVIWFFAASDLKLFPTEKTNKDKAAFIPGLKTFGTAAGFILLLGMLLPIAEWIIPQRYSTANQQSALNIAGQVEIRQEAIGDIQTFLQQPKAVQMVGRALYPRWYQGGEGELGNGWPAFTAKSKAHLGFVFVGTEEPHQMVLIQNQSPDVFPHASDVIIFGCQRPDFIDVRLVVGYNQPEVFAYKADGLSQLCE